MLLGTFGERSSWARGAPCAAGIRARRQRLGEQRLL